MKRSRYLLIPIAVSLALLPVLMLCILGAGKPDAAAQPAFRVLRGSDLGAAGVYRTTINKGAYQSPSSVQFYSLSQSFTSSACSVLQQTVSSGSATSLMTAASPGDMQMLYVYSSGLDGVLTIYDNTAGTGSAISGGTVAITAGNPYEWDALTSGTSSLMLSPTNSMAFTAGTTAGGLTTSTTQTSVTAAALYP